VPELERSRDRRDRGNKQQAKKGETTDIKLPLSTQSSRPRGNKFGLVF